MDPQCFCLVVSLLDCCIVCLILLTFTMICEYESLACYSNKHLYDSILSFFMICVLVTSTNPSKVGLLAASLFNVQLAVRDPNSWPVFTLSLSFFNVYTCKRSPMLCPHPIMLYTVNAISGASEQQKGQCDAHRLKYGL